MIINHIQHPKIYPSCQVDPLRTMHRGHGHPLLEAACHTVEPGHTVPGEELPPAGPCAAGLQRLHFCASLRPPGGRMGGPRPPGPGGGSPEFGEGDPIRPETPSDRRKTAQSERDHRWTTSPPQCGHSPLGATHRHLIQQRHNRRGGWPICWFPFWKTSN
jgi:hypothetical protein